MFIKLSQLLRIKDKKQKLIVTVKKKMLGPLTMIACDNVECEIEWFHVKCLQLENIYTER